MCGPGTASLKFALWLVCATFFLHCLMVPTAVTEVAQRSYKVKRGVLRTGLMPREAYIPPSKSKRSKRSLCAIECSVKEGCLAFNVDRSTGKCELFDTEVGGRLVSNDNSSYCGDMVSAPNDTRCILLIGGDMSNEAAAVEYYHPIEGVECNIDIIGNMSIERIRGDTYFTSGCYLPSTREIVIRETDINNKPPILYGLTDKSATQLPRPYDNKGTYSSTASALGPSKCLSCGGNADGTALNNCYQFDPSLDDSKWTPIASMPYQSAYAASVSLTENDFYVMGGLNANYLSQLYHFNVGDGTWTEETPMPAIRGRHSAAALSDTEFIVCGGRDAGGTLSSCEIYDTTQKKWSTTGSMKQTRGGFAMFTFGGDIYAVGGYEDGIIRNTVEKYDRATGEWEMAKAIQHPRDYFVGVAV